MLVYVLVKLAALGPPSNLTSPSRKALDILRDLPWPVLSLYFFSKVPLFDN